MADEYPSYVEDALRMVQLGYEVARSVDGFLTKLETAIAYILDNDQRADVKAFLALLKERGFLDKLACHRDELEELLSSPRHSILRGYRELLYEVLKDVRCAEGYRYLMLPQSKEAGQVSVSGVYRDVAQRRPRLPSKGALLNRRVTRLILRNLHYIALLAVLAIIAYGTYVAILSLSH